MNCDFPNDFSTAAHEVLSFLHDRLGLGLWMVMRSEGDNWTVLAAEDHCYGVRDGSVFHWSEPVSGFAWESEGAGERTLGDVLDEARLAWVFQGTPSIARFSGQQIDVGTYVGIPLRDANGVLHGSLCALDPMSRDEDPLRGEQDLVEMLAGILCRLLRSELKAEEEARRAEMAEAESLRDSLTTLYGRRGWNLLLRKEEERCARYGHPAYVVFVDLDDLKVVNDTLGHAAGDELLIRTGRTLMDVTRHSDVVARVGGDEFAVLAVECDEAAAGSLVDKLRDQLRSANINASIGFAARRPGHGLEAALLEADAAMYRQKRYRKSVANMAHDTMADYMAVTLHSVC